MAEVLLASTIWCEIAYEKQQTQCGNAESETGELIQYLFKI